MANPEHLEILNQGVASWNKWRDEHPEITPNFYIAKLNDVDLHGVNLRGAEIRGTNLRSANLRSADLSSANFSNADLSNTDLSNADLSNSNLSYANLKYATLHYANFTHANLSDADLEGALLYEANLSYAILTQASLQGANISYANLKGTDLSRGADLDGAMLTHTDLSGAKLRLAKLYRADFSYANLVNADLSGARLGNANFNNSNLSGANISGSDLSNADFMGANLSNADASRAYLTGSKFVGTNLSSANFHEANMFRTIFADLDLRVVNGLETVSHRGPSEISISTIYRSEGKIPEVFLRGCGMAEEFIVQIPSLVTAIQPIQFYSCFISYSHKDEDFARRLHSRMREANLRVWYAPEEMKGGQKLHEQIYEAIHVHDKLLLVLSENSLKSEWVATEIRRARKTEREENRRKLFPIRLVDFDTLRNWECFDADSGKDLGIELREYFIPDFSDWKDHDAFETAFNKLLGALKSEETNKPIPAIQDDLHQRAILAPRQTLIDEWDKVESSIVEVAKRNGLTKAGELVDCSRLINQLFEAGKISQEIREEFFDLSHIHNNIAFNDFSSVEPGMAIHFAERAREMKKAFEITE